MLLPILMPSPRIPIPHSLPRVDDASWSESSWTDAPAAGGGLFHAPDSSRSAYLYLSDTGRDRNTYRLGDVQELLVQHIRHVTSRAGGRARQRVTVNGS